jgi:hypothetical protein
VDRHRNDRLGRQLRFEHRREILRRCSESDTHANTFSDPNRDSHTNGHCNSNAERYCEAQSDSAASPHTGTSTLEVQLRHNYENNQQN